LNQFSFSPLSKISPYITINAMSPDNRGLASADEEARERVARKGGESSRGGGRKD
jgi:hypothetical protein